MSHLLLFIGLRNCGIEKDGILTSHNALLRMTNWVNEIAMSSNQRTIELLAIRLCHICHYLAVIFRRFKKFQIKVKLRIDLGWCEARS